MLYRFQIDVSHVDRGFYESLDFRVAQHPSETAPYLLSRTLAFALCHQRGLDFSPGGLSDPDAPAIKSIGDNGSIDLWIEIGNPSARKLHKATKVASAVKVFTYKNPEALMTEIKSGEVHKAEEIEVFAFDPKFLLELEKHLEKNNKWVMLFQDGQLDLQIGENSLTTTVKRF
jgi:uncharacterized protein YaeQ